MFGWVKNLGHRRYRELLNARLDGRLDANGGARLQSHLASCAECRAELSELEATVVLLRGAPQVEPPRSFALPYAPRQDEATAGWRAPGRLRTMQVATATAALVLVAVVSVDLSGLTDDSTMVFLDEFSAAQTEAVGTPAGTEMLTASPPDSDEEAKSSAFAAAEDVTAPPSAEAAPADRLAGEGRTAPTGRTAIEWLLIAVALATAVLALGMTAWTWRVTQRPPG